MSDDPLIQAKNLNKSYAEDGGRLRVLCDMDLAVDEGELLVIVGAINWGVIGVTSLTNGQLNMVEAASEVIFQPGVAETVAALVYVLVGVAGIYLLYTGYKMSRINRRVSRRQERPAEQGTEQRQTE